MSKQHFEVTLQPCGCSKPSVAVMDYLKPTNTRWTKFSPRVNRCCLTCKAHWAGPVNQVTFYTSKQWDAHLATALAA